MIAGKPGPLSQAVQDSLIGNGYRSLLFFPPNDDRLSDRSVPAKPQDDDPDSAVTWSKLKNVVEKHPACSVINLLNLECRDRSQARKNLLTLFRLTQLALQPLRRAAVAGDGLVLNLTNMGGQLGIRPSLGSSKTKPSSFDRYYLAGSFGFCKSLAREFPELDITNLDLPTDVTIEQIVDVALGQVSGSWRIEEAGQDSGRIVRPVLRMSTPSHRPNRMLNQHSTVVLTGGGRGITALIAHGIAEKYKCRVIIAGRTEPADAQACGISLHEFRETLIAEARSGATPRVSAVAIEEPVEKRSRQLELERTLTRLRSTGAAIEYHAVDATCERTFGRFLRELYDRFGKIDGVVHGAGVIRDSRLERKSESDFAQVFDTKTGSAEILAGNLDPGSLRFLCFFSSIAARFGNAGQTDYAAANEYLNRFAQHLNRTWNARVFSINWGPWEPLCPDPRTNSGSETGDMIRTGMVKAPVKARFERLGVRLIDPAAGVQAFLRELEYGSPDQAEVVLTHGLDKLLELGSREVGNG